MFVILALEIFILIIIWLTALNLLSNLNNIFSSLKVLTNIFWNLLSLIKKALSRAMKTFSKGIFVNLSLECLNSISKISIKVPGKKFYNSSKFAKSTGLFKPIK